MHPSSTPLPAPPAVDADPVDALQRTMRAVIPFGPIAAVVGREATVWYYALPRRLAAHVPPGSRPFTMHEKSGIGTVLFAMAFVALAEAGAAHVVLRRWTAAGAWTATALSVYGAIWLIALARAFALRPTLVDSEGVTLRAGLLRAVRLGARDIAEIRPPRRRPARREPHYVSFTLLGAPTLIIKLRAPVDVGGLFGTTSGVTHIGVAPDDQAGFLACWNH